MASKAAAQRRPRLRQPPSQRALTRTQLLGRFVLSSAFQIAEDQRQPPFLWQSFQFGIQDRSQFPPWKFLGREACGRRLLLMTATSLTSSPSLERYPAGDAMKPPSSLLVASTSKVRPGLSTVVVPS